MYRCHGRCDLALIFDAPNVVEAQITAPVCIKVVRQWLIEEHTDVVIVTKTLASSLTSAASRAARVGGQLFASAPKVIVVGVRIALDPTHVALTLDDQPVRQKTS